jgi:serine/threonine protein kinase/uncharacterized membrane protein YgcG
MGSLPNGIHFDPDNAMNSFDMFADLPFVDGGMVGAANDMFAQNQQMAASMAPQLNFPINGSFTDEAIDAGNLDMLNAPYSRAPEMASFDTINSDFFGSASASTYTPQQTLDMNRFIGNNSWNSPQCHPFSNDDLISTQPISSTPNFHKRPLECTTQDLPQPKRQVLSDYQTLSPFTTTSTVPSTTAADSIWTPGTSLSQSEVGLADDAADMCATWFSKYNVFPSEQHIAALSLLTRESPSAIQQWFGQILKQGMAGSHDSAYKSQSTLGQEAQSNGNTTDSQTSQDAPGACSHETAQTSTQPQTARRGKKGCTPTDNLDLLSRDDTKIYQCTRKCGKRYGRKCDWKRSEEEGYPSKSWLCSLCRDQGIGRVKPCYRRYHFKQHFTNIHPELDFADYEVDSIVHSETEFPRRCGFCPKTFSSRQERIDHIAEHFQKGSYMLQWKDYEDEGGDQDDGADDDDRPDSDSFGDGSPSSRGPSNDQYQSGSKGQGGGSSGGGGGNLGGGSYYGAGQQYTLSDASPPQKLEDLDGKNHQSLEGKNHQSLEGKNHQSQETKAPSSQQTDAKARRDRTVVDLNLIKQILSHFPEAPKRPTVSTDHLITSQGIQEPETATLSLLDQDNNLDYCLTTQESQPSLYEATTMPPDIIYPPSPPADRSKPVGGRSSGISSEVFAQELTQEFADILRTKCFTELKKKSDATDQAKTSTQPWRIPERESHASLTSSAKPAVGPTEAAAGLNALTKANRAIQRLISLEDTRYGPRRQSETEIKGQGENEPQVSYDLDVATQASKYADACRRRKPLGEIVGSRKKQFSCTFCSGSEKQFFRKSDWVRHENERLKTDQEWPTSMSVLSTRGLSDQSTTDIPKRSTPHSSSVFIGGSEDIAKRRRSSAMPSSERVFRKYLSESPYLVSRGSSANRSFVSRWEPLFAISQEDSKRPTSDDKQYLHSQQNENLARSGCFLGDGDLFHSHLFDVKPSNISPTDYMNLAVEIAKETLEMTGLMPSPIYPATFAPPDLISHFAGGLQDLYSRNGFVQESSYLVPVLGTSSAGKSFLSLKLLGAGGFSTVDEVLHRHTKLHISRKTLKSRSESNLAELQKEVSILRKLRHPHIIRFLDSYTQGNKVSILLSPVADTTLAAWLEKCSIENPPGIEEKIVKMYGCLASSVRYLHQQRPVIKHMDIKPQNILVTHTDSNFPQVILCDFGISEFSEDSTDDGHSAPLTRQYCAPETAASQTRGAKADIWSLGCVFLEMAVVVLIHRNDAYRKFRKDFCGCDGRAYWQDVSGLHAWLSIFQETTDSTDEKCVLRTIQTMLSPDPKNRPEAVTLTILFAPAPCCLQFSSQESLFPGPEEERSMVEMLVSHETLDCASKLHVGTFESESSECPTRKEGRNQSHVHHNPKAWLNECLTEHAFCRANHSNSKTLPTRLLEVLNANVPEPSLRLVITSTLPSVEYAALSLSWSLDRPQCVLTTENIATLQERLPDDFVPQQIKDAVAACLQLGIRYLWVDSLCVMQDSPDDRMAECLAMASTYRDAILTIVLDAGTDVATTSNDIPFRNASSSSSSSSSSSGDNNTSATKPLPHQDLWDSRQWTLQERLLSKRLLYVTPHQLYWDCHGLKASDTFPQGLPPLVWEKVHSRPLEAPRDRVGGEFGIGMVNEKEMDTVVPFWAPQQDGMEMEMEADGAMKPQVKSADSDGRAIWTDDGSALRSNASGMYGCAPVVDGLGNGKLEMEVEMREPE